MICLQVPYNSAVIVVRVSYKTLPDLRRSYDPEVPVPSRILVRTELGIRMVKCIPMYNRIQVKSKFDHPGTSIGRSITALPSGFG
jgi:hypothetical protein